MSTPQHQSRSSLYSSRKSSGSRTNVAGSVSKRNVAFDSKLDKPAPKKNTVTVLDESGEDVTPKPLTNAASEAAAAAAAQGTQTKPSKHGINFNDNASIATPSELFNQSMFGASTYQASYAAGFSKSMMSSQMMGSSKASLDSVTDEMALEPSHGGNDVSGLEGIKHEPTEVKAVDLTEDDLDKMITINLEETETIWHLDIISTIVCEGSDEAESVKLRNEQYEKLLETREGNDMYIEKGMQTFNDAPKTKDVQTEPVGKKDVGSMATTWDMYDTYNVKEQENLPKDEEEVEKLEGTSSNRKIPSEESGGATSQLGQSRQDTDRSMMTASQATDTSESEEVQSNPSDVTVAQSNRIMKLDSMKQNLFIMERTVVQNVYHQRQAAFRGLQALAIPVEVEEGEEKEAEAKPDEADIKLGPNLSKLWSYECPQTKGRTVNCMVWNTANPDLLAVGYGQYGFNEKSKGLICVWSIKNPEYPERVHTTRCAVTSMDFSTTHPNMLAIGLFDGTIQVLNVRNTSDLELLDSLDSPGKHTSAVWELRWVERDKGTGEEKGEVLISCSADGRVTQWSIRKGFEYLDLMKLKRVNTSKKADKDQKKPESKKSDALISRYTSGMCFDFHHVDGNLYMVGTEEGHIHKCSCSYNEQFLESYSAHTGPVYRTKWSPFDDSAFLSCSADWTVRLWHQERLNPLLTLQGSTKAIHDIAWSPFSPTMFAAINDDQIEVWDLAVSILDPLLVNLPVTQKVSLSSVMFAKNSDALLVGDSEGHVTIYQMREMPVSNITGEDWLTAITSTANHGDEEETGGGAGEAAGNEEAAGAGGSPVPER